MKMCAINVIKKWFNFKTTCQANVSLFFLLLFSCKQRHTFTTSSDSIEKVYKLCLLYIVTNKYRGG